MACNERDQAAKSASNPMTCRTTASRRPGRPIREQRARIIGDWLQTEARFLVLMMHLTPVFEFALLLVVPGALVILLAALLLTGRT